MTIPETTWLDFLAQVEHMRALQVNYRLTLSPFTRRDMQAAEALVDVAVHRLLYAVREGVTEEPAAAAEGGVA